MLPYLATIPSPCQLQKLNEELQMHRDNLNKEVTQRTYELKQEQAKWKMITEQNPNILWLKNTSGKIEYYNNKWYEYTGLALNEESACRAIHPVDLELMHKKWVEGQYNKEVTDYKIRIKGANNEYRWHLVRCVPLRDVETNEIIQYCGISTDIHDTEMVNELSQADATRKSRFLAMISHEMRTPLTGIIGMSTLLGDTQLLPSQVEILGNVKENADKLLNLVNNILDLFKMHNDKLYLEVSTFELADCVQEALVGVRGAAVQKEITLHDEVDHALLPSLVQADRARLKQVLDNLLSNAVKFTPEGGHIYLSATRDSTDSKSLVKFSVRDTGIGIQEQDMVKVFETFTQLDASSTRRFGGTGVGLAISKGLVELMRGTIWCESTPGQGATFYFTFEVADVTNEGVARSGLSRAPIASTPLLYAASCDDMLDSNGMIISDIPLGVREAEDLSTDTDDGDFICIVRPKILVVDDTEMNQKVLKRFLVSLGYSDVDAVYNGEQAVDAVRNNGNSQTYDIIFMDMEMPVMDGVTASRQIRDLKLPKQPHIIAVTANAFQEDIEKCLNAGMCGHMPKPIKREELKKRMERSFQVLGGTADCTCHKHQQQQSLNNRHPHLHPHSHSRTLVPAS
jgi:signal transduction histidine kinase/CheY-like chemotaxis protein